MAQKLDEFKISDWALIVDLLGTASTMAENVAWIQAIENILTVIEASVHETINMTNPDRNIHTYQYGDTVNFFSDDPQELMLLAVILQKKLFQMDQLAKMGLAYGGVYDLTQINFIKKLTNQHGRLVAQCLAGRATSKGHLLMGKIKGPRIFIDEEVPIAPNHKAWERFSSPKVKIPDVGFPRAEVAWWRQVNDIDADVKNRIAKLDMEIQARTQSNINADPAEKRRIDSLAARKEHLEAFRNVLDNDL